MTQHTYYSAPNILRSENSVPNHTIEGLTLPPAGCYGSELTQSVVEKSAG